MTFNEVGEYTPGCVEATCYSICGLIFFFGIVWFLFEVIMSAVVEAG